MAKIKVLVADDVKIMRSLLKNSLMSFDCEIVAEVDNGLQVVDQIRHSLPDIVFLDINMPGIDGLAVLQDIKAVFQDLFVAMISGHNSFNNIQRSIELGADGFVSKPYTTIKIREMIDKYREQK